VSRPDAVVLDDLTAPRFSAEAKAVLEQMAAAAPLCSLEPDAVMAAASEQTGLNDFGDDSFHERLDVLCRSLRDEAGLSPVGVVAMFGSVVTSLRNRLLVEDLLKRHPEIHDERLERPIIICGLPRTGTTHLHNLMAADPALRSLPYWESLEPVTDDVDGAKERTAQGLAVSDLVMPHFKRMHEMTVDHVHEEIQLLALDVSTMLFETFGVMPTWRDYYLSHDQTPSYEYLRTVIKALQWQRGGRRRWVLKSPQHLEQLPVLRRVFPDATYVLTHRDPVAITASMATMTAYTARMTKLQPDPHAIGRYWAEAVERLLHACVRDRDVLPDDQTIDVRFHEFMADDMAMVERVYKVADQPLDDRARDAMAAFLRANPRGKHGTVVYSLEALGLDRSERRKALQFYVERFGVEIEGE
jgi:hypothetical protein